MKVKIEGIDKLKKALDKHVRDLGKAFESASETVADTFIDRNDVYVPLETGALRDSGGHFQEGTGWQTVTVVGYGFETSQNFFRAGRKDPQEPWKYAFGDHGQENNYDPKRTAGTIILFMEKGFENYRQEAFDTITMELSQV